MTPRSFPSLLFLLSAFWFSTVSAVGHPPGMLGVSLDEVGSEHVQSLALPGEYGARVTGVAADSPAAEADVRADDVVVAYNGVRVESARSLQRMILETPAGRKVELRLIREGSPVLVQPVLGQGRMPVGAAASTRPPRSLGVWVESIAPAVGQYLGLDEGVGVIVRDLKEGSPAAEAGLQPKDVLTALDGEPIPDPKTLGRSVKELPGIRATLTVIRGSETLDVPVQF